MTYDPSTNRGKVRLLISDTSNSPATEVFTDAEIDTFLTLEGSSVKLAAASALDTIASNEALTAKVITTQDLSVDGAKLADALRKGAEALRKQADAAGETPAGFELSVAAFEPYGSWPAELTEWPLTW